MCETGQTKWIRSYIVPQLSDAASSSTIGNKFKYNLLQFLGRYLYYAHKHYRKQKKDYRLFLIATG